MSLAQPTEQRTLWTRRKTVFRLILAFVLMFGLALLTMIRFTEQAIAPLAATQAAPAPAPAVAEGRGDGLPVLIAPVEGAAIVDSWGQSRDSGARPHQGTDIMAPAGAPVRAAAAGTVEKLFDSQAGGHTLYIRSPDRRWSYYYAHLSGYAPGIVAGKPVRAGDEIAFVGDTGNAGAGNYHLHFGLSRMTPGDGWWQGEPVNPYPMLVGKAAGR
ncbi:M23 family metallopeptidase [Sphingomonas sp.]|uniref:M23 family metallopeptidase n=1 Tax=Sphingomonas sp. TaxID=28214 RepID=UPI002B8886AB|nr:M23 family metallopeptidase [Sphingomonas sp.]HWK37036.1 M23 family metallopeptidase [Sphingomonas sp.]